MERALGLHPVYVLLDGVFAYQRVPIGRLNPNGGGSVTLWVHIQQ